MHIKMIIAGGRDYTDADNIRYHLQHLIRSNPDKYFTIISGMARGADITGAEVARSLGLHVLEFPALWDDLNAPGAVIRPNRVTGKPYNAVAGFQRNQRMADEADALLAFWDGKSRGTADMIRIMKEAGKIVITFMY